MGGKKLTVVHGAGIITVDSEERIYVNGALAIEGDQIVAVGHSSSVLAEYSSRADEIIDFEGSWILPGGQHVSGMVKAVDELGIRACLTRSTMDSGVGLPALWASESTDTCMKIQEDLFTRFNASADDRIRIWFGLRQILNATDDLLLRTKEAAAKCNTGIHMHVAEIPFENEWVMESRGVEHGTVSYLNKIGLLDHNLLAAHSVWVDASEVEMMAQARVKVSHCPAAAMRMLGFAPVAEMLSAGICVSLVDEMYLASLINKGRVVFERGTTDPTALPAETILKMATINGAKSVLQGQSIGSLEVGKKADLIVVNPDKWTMIPLHDPISSMVYCMRTENISSVMCNGNWIMRDQKILTVDEALVMANAKNAAMKLITRAGIQLPKRGNVIY
ncbi:hypothetical protein AXG93_3105s1110 [Marchantia polymorpha subsp. ruderalis]|uniref:Amidohydrolase-related domain-containing protein n=1 Tax=Marchantia polymorpha subsp. ruderalis TaxID=1480154 RepID=A0A176WK14_MARPO|nr:hypothetical protein AXG93_3105s1110 [Marchantia polymorpha subsp. ruderalis]